MATYAESVWQHSPALADCVGQPWERVSLHSANSERVEQALDGMQASTQTHFTLRLGLTF